MKQPTQEVILSRRANKANINLSSVTTENSKIKYNTSCDDEVDEGTIGKFW